MCIRSQFLLHDVIIPCTLPVIWSLHNVVNNGNWPKWQNFIPVFSGWIFQHLASSRSMRVHRSDFLPLLVVFHRFGMILTLLLVEETHVKQSHISNLHFLALSRRSLINCVCVSIFWGNFKGLTAISDSPSSFLCTYFIPVIWLQNTCVFSKLISHNVVQMPKFCCIEAEAVGALLLWTSTNACNTRGSCQIPRSLTGSPGTSMKQQAHLSWYYIGSSRKFLS